MTRLIVFGCLLLLVGLAVSAQVVEVREDGRVTLSATPQVVGNNVSRRSVSFHNSSNAAGPMCCGKYPATLNCATPGPNTGKRYGPSEGEVICDAAHEPLYCINDGSNAAEANYFDIRMATVTSTPTATATVTPTNTPTP